MIRSSGKPVNLIYNGKKLVNKVLSGVKLVWELVYGCFTKGY